MRSSLISGCFLAYGFGNIAINLITMVIRKASHLAITALLLVCCSIIPSFFSYVETPKFQYKAGKLSGIIHVLMNMAKANGKNLTREDLLTDFTDGDEDIASALREKQIRVKIVKSKEEDASSQQSPMIEMLTTGKYLYQVIAMACQGGVLYIVFYGMATSVQDLGLKNINYNGIFFGITQSVGYMSVLPFIHKQKRKTWSIIY